MNPVLTSIILGVLRLLRYRPHGNYCFLFEAPLRFERRDRRTLAIASWLLGGGVKARVSRTGIVHQTLFNDANGEQQMLESRDEWIKKRAYAIWEEEGYPSGRDAALWAQASSERIALEKTTAEGGTIDIKPKAKRKTAVAAAAVAEEKLAKPAKKISKKAAAAKI
ncbi:DUF2934 domain-containing protein [Rhizobium sp.]|uniref:DUF2934 domain-containing protein n=1 Tax=Rhizobium sp. TaxID=391 RepID=UPI003F7DDEA5